MKHLIEPSHSPAMTIAAATLCVIGIVIVLVAMLVSLT
jgi:hypothetical protein